MVAPEAGQMTGLDLRVQNLLKFHLAFLGASTDDLSVIFPLEGAKLKFILELLRFAE